MEHGATTGVVGTAERAARFAHDTGRQGQAQAQAIARALGGEKRLEQMGNRLFRQPWPMVTHLHMHLAMEQFSPHMHTRRGRTRHGIKRVVDQVDQHLRQAVAIAPGHRLSFCHLHIHLCTGLLNA